MEREDGAERLVRLVRLVKISNWWLGKSRDLKYNCVWPELNRGEVQVMLKSRNKLWLKCKKR